MIVSITFIICDGCGLRVEGDQVPERWHTVQRGTSALLFHNSLCFAESEGLDVGTIRIARSRRYGITPRELMVLERVARGQTNSRIAADLGIAQQTMKNTLRNVLLKLGVSSRAAAALYAGHVGLIDMAMLGEDVERTTAPIVEANDGDDA